MTRLNKNKKSKYVVFIGWGLMLYADNLNDINKLKMTYGNDKISYENI